MRILIADKFDATGLEALEAASFEVAFEPDLSTDDLPQRMVSFDPDALVVRSTRVTGDVIDAGKSLSLIVRAGAGFDTIDVATASSEGVFIANCPGRNALAVAEIAWGLILACDRRIPDQTIDLRSGKWRKKQYAKASGLASRTLGVVGLGQIGRAVIERGRAFGMNVAAWSRSLDEETANELGITRCENLLNLARMSDVISINIAATDETRNLIDERFVDAMRENAILVNTSRGSIVDASALQKGIREKGIRAGLDVFATEPSSGEADFEDPIVQEANVYGTHHVGASTAQAQESIAMEVVRIVTSYRDTGQVPNCVNRSGPGRSAALLTVRHRNKPGVLARVFDILSCAGINVEEMENLIYEGGESACARIQLASTPSIAEIESIQREETVLGVSVAGLETVKS